jgi:hypothetical protein
LPYPYVANKYSSHSTQTFISKENILLTIDLEMRGSDHLASPVPLLFLPMKNRHSRQSGLETMFSSPKNSPLLINPTTAAAPDSFYRDYSEWRGYRPPKHTGFHFQKKRKRCQLLIGSHL